jgi:hypothetical protein
MLIWKDLESDCRENDAERSGGDLEIFTCLEPYFQDRLAYETAEERVPLGGDEIQAAPVSAGPYHALMASSNIAAISSPPAGRGDNLVTRC